MYRQSSQITRRHHLVTLLSFIVLSVLFPQQVKAWWNDDWAYRQLLTIDATQSGVALRDRAFDVPVIVRLHGGNFTFDALKADGGDIRIISEDDRTPLSFSIERFEKESGIAIIRVLVPAIEPGKRTNLWIYYGNGEAKTASDRTAVRDRLTVLSFNFEQMGAALADTTAFGNNAGRLNAKPTSGGAVGDAAAFTTGSFIEVPASPSLQFARAGGFTLSGWVRVESAADMPIAMIGDTILVSVAGGRLVASIAQPGGTTVELDGGPLAPGGWRHIALTIGPQTATLFVNGEEKASATAPNALPAGGVVLLGSETGSGLNGGIDEFELHKAVRAAEWLRAAALGNGPEGRLAIVGGAEEKSQLSTYLALLGTIVGTVSTDGWVIIALTLILFLIAIEVTISKGLMLQRTSKANAKYLTGRKLGSTDTAATAASPLARIEAAANTAVSEAKVATNDLPSIMETVRSAIARALIGEASLLNRNMVLLTLTISGAPFLGLLGTVVGVMVTFAGIAASGDVNVNTIAPGISAAIATTVAGLIVAIPALFAYNILMTQIRDRLTEMEVFGEDVISRTALSLKAEADHAL